VIAVYDLKLSPPTFDFIGFLVSAEMRRLKTGEKGLSVLFAPGPESGFRRDTLPPKEPAKRRSMLENIVKPMCRLLPSCVEVSEVDAGVIGKADFPLGWSAHSRAAHYGTEKFTPAYQEGCFPLRVDGVLSNRKLVTITLRQAEYWPERNSNVPAWESLATKLRDSGYTMRVIRGSDLPNALERAKVYASARLNLFVNNGPAWMATFMPQAPCLIFKMCTSEPCTEPEFFAGCGFPVGSQTGRAGHRIVWANDDLETITRETFAALQET
jgi:hypothetical protein